ncbi:MAG TPA: transposase [Ignavibacteria bacterium]|mgnify:CR=1 FL=1|nr:transposase [Ignavibacteria bacterium]
MQNTKNEIYKHYIALDWAKENFALASIQANSIKYKVEEYPSTIKKLKECLSKFSGKKILTIEETTTAHWLYVELFEHVDKVLICEPYYNSLLKSGPKNDKSDAIKLCTLLRNGSLKEVFHTTDELYRLRKLVSAYDDFVKASVRLKNQRSAMFLSEGKDHKKEKILSGNGINMFVTQKQNLIIEEIESVRNEFVKVFKKLKRENPTVSQLIQVPGIAEILAVTILAVVIDANRFADKYKYYAYSGLVKYKKVSGGRNYGKKNVRYSRPLKSSYKIAANAAIGGNNDIREYYEYLIQNNTGTEDARNEIARYISKVSYAIMKYKTDYRPYQWRENMK